MPTFERCASVRRLLDALGRQTVPADAFEVIVSIDGSADGTRAMVEAYRGPLVVTSVWQENRGRSAARNAGLRLARGEIVVFLDDDMEPAPGFVEGHQSAHGGAKPRGVVGAAPIVVADDAPPLVAFVAEAFSERLERLAQAQRVQYLDAYTGNFSAPRALLDAIGGYDEGFRAYGHEDYELLLRLTKAGADLVYERDALAHQHYDKTFPAVARDAMARGRTAVYFAAKHRDIAGDLKLSAYARETRKWRVLRSLLLAATRVYPGTSRMIASVIAWLEPRRPRRMARYYTMALDYFYWVGVRTAVHQRPEGPA